jgi:hypothetical protein
MKPLFPFLFLSTPVLAIPAVTTLTLVNDPIPGQPGKHYGVLDVGISGAGITPSTTTTTLSGTVEAAFDVDNTLGGTSELTLGNGNITATDFSLSGSVLLFGSPIGPYHADATNLAATLFTSTPPGAVTPANGGFAASQHKFSIRQGGVTGAAAGQTFNETFSPSNPFEGIGSGQGSVILTPTTSDAIYQNYDVAVFLPGIVITDTITAGSTITFTANVTGTGDVKATGTLQVPLNEYLAWTIAQGIPGAPGQGDANQDGLPNALAWAFGLDAATNASAGLPAITSSHGFQFEIPGSGSVAGIRLQRSNSLGGWADVPANRISMPFNPLPIGTSGTIIVSPSGDSSEFFRLKVGE